MEDYQKRSIQSNEDWNNDEKKNRKEMTMNSKYRNNINNVKCITNNNKTAGTTTATTISTITTFTKITMSTGATRISTIGPGATTTTQTKTKRAAYQIKDSDKRLVDN